ncbi:MAG: DNA-directed RNA polymerase subunit alpha [Candidatus Fischerbacteria bacterium RBG_13_37_8]|uniref:DNA-directed RNA polymerase subunit alpha n=1 Tax=Candidatus Fischerbacteria bacterium RBG_13_37_8 TaxID=1817863 RepID=A0A1F5VDZ6_9BACT|nr:MAG: DNA-directed RNA polymerase subunit alpha [Candidatus Fischerbacteria bacterium RBG_13_37_8]
MFSEPSFYLPEAIEIEKETLTDSFGRFFAQPFERGFATTLGNSLRRILLSSIEGAAIVAVKIEGAPHEFASIPGVVEDITNIILNLKRLPIKSYVDYHKRLQLKVSRIGEVRAKDIETDADVEIMDPDHYIATIGDKGSLEMEMIVKKAKGYVSSEKNYDRDWGLGYIPFDAIHCPVVKANFIVEPARVGRSTEYEKLTLEIWTNKTLTPIDALVQSAKILINHATIFTGLEAVIPETEEATEWFKLPSDTRELLSQPIENLDLDTRSYNALKRANVQFIKDLVKKSERELIALPHFGKKSMDFVKKRLDEKNLTLEMKL